MNTYKKENIDISDYKSVVDYIYSILAILNIDYYIRNIETIELIEDTMIVIWLKPNDIITNSNLPQIHIYISNTEFENKDIIAKKIIKAFRGFTC